MVGAGSLGLSMEAPEGGDLSGVVIEPSRGLATDLRAAQAFSATRPTYETPLGNGLAIPTGLTSLSAESCGTCHPEIYDEWKVSTHAWAWKDLQFQAEIQKGGAKWMCVNCHTPLRSQQEHWPIALDDDDVDRPHLVPNQRFDRELQQEGITCVGCHLRNGVIHGPGLSASEPPHATQADEAFRGEGICLRCHQAEAAYPGKSFVCTFTTGQEWADSPFKQVGVTCLGCHMPPVKRPAATEGPVRWVRRHWWRGAGIPKVQGVHPPVEANPPGLGLKASTLDGSVHLVLSNERAGHLIPTGDPERWIQIEVEFLGEDGEPLGEPWTYRIGQVWEWSTPPVKRSDNRLAPREARTLDVAIPTGAAKVLVRASSHRISEENAEYHGLLGRYPLSVSTHETELIINPTAGRTAPSGQPDGPDR